jgi:protein O-GlcNAc transferase
MLIANISTEQRKSGKMTLQKALESALQYHQTGDLQQAENLYKQILIEQPDNHFVYQYLGILYYQRKNYDAAIEYIKKALQFNPDDAPAYYNLGTIYKDRGQLNEAIDSFEKSLALQPDNADAYVNKGIIQKESGHFDEALACFHEAVRLNPDHTVAYYNMGVLYKEQKQSDDAIRSFQKTLQLDPNILAAHSHLGYIYYDTDRLDEAVACYQNAIQTNPNLADLYYNLGLVFQKMHKLNDAIAHYQKAIQLDPLAVDSYSNLGIAFQGRGELDHAIDCYQRAIRVKPDLAELYCNLGNALRKKGRLGEAINSFKVALDLKHDFAEAYTNLGNVYKDQGDLDKAEACYRSALEIRPDCVSCYNNLLLSMNYNQKYDAQTIAAEHRQFMKKVIEPLSFPPIYHLNERDPGRRLKIGYVSPDFRRHPVACFIEPVFTAYNKKHFEVFCYSNNTKEDEVTHRMQRMTDRWRSVAGMSDKDAAELIQKDRIDILIDLAGHTEDNRILVFARKPAPIQASWIGYLATTGLSTMDYKIADNYTDPPGKTEQFYTENLLRLPESFLCYLPDKDSPDIGNLPALSAGHITFGSFNNFAKVTPEVFSVWAIILKEIPDACFILKGRRFNDKYLCEYVIDMFQRRDIEAHRIILQLPDPSPKHMEAYNLIDIALDTFPFNGAATTCEAMWMGVPVITLAGAAYHARVGVSLLSNAGLPELVAATSDEYSSMAVALARDLRRLQSLREHLRDMMRSSPLCNTLNFTFALEKCYRQIWEQWCKSS